MHTDTQLQTHRQMAIPIAAHMFRHDCFLAYLTLLLQLPHSCPHLDTAFLLLFLLHNTSTCQAPSSQLPNSYPHLDAALLPLASGVNPARPPCDAVIQQHAEAHRGHQQPCGQVLGVWGVCKGVKCTHYEACVGGCGGRVRGCRGCGGCGRSALGSTYVCIHADACGFQWTFAHKAVSCERRLVPPTPTLDVPQLSSNATSEENSAYCSAAAAPAAPVPAAAAAPAADRS